MDSEIRRKIVLVSNDSDFYEYMLSRIRLRNSDELFKYNFDNLQSILDSFECTVLIINSENNVAQTLDLLNIIDKAPAFIFSTDENTELKVKAYNCGAFGYITKNTSNEELNSQLKAALKFVSSLERAKLYRNMLVNNNLIAKNNEVFMDFVEILDTQIDKIHKSAVNAVLLAISPNDNSKFLIQTNQIETIILNFIRENDILMNYSPSKYFLLLKNVNLNQAKDVWRKICTVLPKGIYAGFTDISNKTRQQVVNEVLNKLHLEINKQAIGTSNNNNILSLEKNFKSFRKEVKQKIEQVVSPVFYHIQQSYNNKLFGITIEQKIGDGFGVFNIKSNYASGSLKLTSPGFTTVNIDVTYKGLNKQKEVSESKRITLEATELEEGLLQDILEQFIIEFKNNYRNNGEITNDNT